MKARSVVNVEKNGFKDFLKIQIIVSSLGIAFCFALLIGMSILRAVDIKAYSQASDSLNQVVHKIYGQQ
jgi:hypothetical protein